MIIALNGYNNNIFTLAGNPPFIHLPHGQMLIHSLTIVTSGDQLLLNIDDHP